jgi:RimJ/RimL family protein N-acetyltransferase
MSLNAHTFNFKPLAESDLPFLFEWFAQPYIAQLWKEPDWRTFQEKYRKRISSNDIFPFVAYIDDKPIAYIKYHHVKDDDRALFPNVEIPAFSIGLDLFIGNPNYLGKGYGTHLVKEFIQFVQKIEPHCTTIIIDPAVDNHRAIRCYEKVGFKIVGTYITPYGPTGEGPGPILLMMYNFPTPD